MRILLDTHFVIELVNSSFNKFDFLTPHAALANLNLVNVSVVSLWEVAIKSRLGKLPLKTPVNEWPAFLAHAEVPLLTITHNHVLAEVAPEVHTRDPFDRLLLGICTVESLRLVTIDRQLVDHPLAWRPFPV